MSIIVDQILAMLNYASVTQVLSSFFAQSKILMGKPSYKTMPNGKVVVQVTYYVPNSVVPLADNKINALGVAIAQLLAGDQRSPDTRVELRLVRLQYPYLESSILAQYVAINAGKFNFLRMRKMVMSKSAALISGKSGLGSGLKLELAGRLTTQRSIPRKTVENGHTGSFSGKALDFSQYASKNKLGAFTIKV